MFLLNNYYNISQCVVIMLIAVPIRLTRLWSFEKCTTLTPESVTFHIYEHNRFIPVLLCEGLMMSLSDDEQADVIDAFNTTSRYLDDILNINNVYFDNMVSLI